MIKRSHTVGKAAGHGKGILYSNGMLHRNHLGCAPRNLHIFGSIFPFRQEIIYRIRETERPFLKQYHADGISKQFCCGRLAENGTFVDFSPLFDISEAGIAFVENIMILHDDTGTAGNRTLCKRIKQPVKIF